MLFVCLLCVLRWSVFFKFCFTVALLTHLRYKCRLSSMLHCVFVLTDKGTFVGHTVTFIQNLFSNLPSICVRFCWVTGETIHICLDQFVF